MKKFYLLITALFMLPFAMFAQNADSCVTATEITGPGTYTVEDLTGEGGTNSGAAAWFYYTPTQDGTITIETCDQGVDTEFEVFDGDCGALNVIANGTDNCPTGNGNNWAAAVYAVPVVSGTTYYIEFHDQYETTGFDFVFDFALPVEGDGCNLPIVVDFASDLPYEDLSQTNCGRGDTYDATCMGSYDNGEDIIYQLVLDQNYSVKFKLDPKGTTYAGIGLFDACPGADNCIQTQTWGSSGDVDSMTVEVSAGTYYFMVDTWSSPDCIPDFDLNITATVVTCPISSGLVVTDVTASDVTFNWNADGTDYEYAVDTAGFDVSLATYTATTDTFATVTGLEPETDYDVYVRLNCGADQGDWTMVSFTTPCVVSVMMTPYSEDFEGLVAPELPCGWIVENDNGDGVTWVSNAGNLYISYNSSLAMDDHALSPYIAMTGGTSYTVEFDFRNSGTTYLENLMVILSDVNGPIDTLFNFVDYGNSTFVTYSENYTPAADGDYYLDFYGYSAADQWYMRIDNLNVYETPDCLPVTGLEGTDITETGATTVWNPDGNTSWDYAWGESGFDIDTATLTTTTDTFFVATGLVPGVVYDVYVRTNCGASVSEWTVLTGALPPLNDQVCNAADIVVDGDAVTVDNTWATWGGDSASCWGTYTNGDVWLMFEFTPTAGANGIEITTAAGTSDDSHIALYSVSGCPDMADATELACHEDIGGPDNNWMSYIPGTALEAGTYYIQCATWTGAEGSYDVEVNSVYVSDTCSTFLGGPWNDFNTAFGGAPVDSAGICPFNEITAFQVWASEAYTVDNFESGETYTFSMCGGDYGAWMPELSIWDEDGNIVMMTQDTCAITWTATYDGTYIIGINEVDACGAASDNTSTDNGYPALTCDGSVAVSEIDKASFSIYPNPNNGLFNIVNEGQAGNYIIEVMDITGRVVYAEQLQLNGNAQTEINTSNVNTGVYLVKMTNTEDNYHRTIRMVIK